MKRTLISLSIRKDQSVHQPERQEEDALIAALKKKKFAPIGNAPFVTHHFVFRKAEIVSVNITLNIM